MKLKVSLKRSIPSFIIASLVAAALLFGMTYEHFFSWPWSWEPYVIIILWVISTIAFMLSTIFGSYYVLEKKYVEVHRYKKVLVYQFDDVLFIDEELSIKKKTIYFYMKQGSSRYLTFDKDGILYRAMLEKCKNRMSKEEFYRTHPGVKL